MDKCEGVPDFEVFGANGVVPDPSWECGVESIKKGFTCKLADEACPNQATCDKGVWKPTGKCKPIPIKCPATPDIEG